MRLRSISYLALFINLLGIFETGIRLVASSIASKHKIELAVTTDMEDDDATKERERTDAKEYIHEIGQPLLITPVYKLKQALAIYVSDFSYQFYSEVLTPPPNC